MRKTIRLTAATAKALVKKALGVSGQGLEREKTNPVMCIYKMRIGALEIKVSNDWYRKNGRYEVVISSEASGNIWLYFFPETLEEDWEEEQRKLAEIQREWCADCRESKDSPPRGAGCDRIVWEG